MYTIRNLKVPLLRSKEQRTRASHLLGCQKKKKKQLHFFEKRMKKEEAVAKAKSKRASLNPLMKSMIRKC